MKTTHRKEITQLREDGIRRISAGEDWHAWKEEIRGVKFLYENDITDILTDVMAEVQEQFVPGIRWHLTNSGTAVNPGLHPVLFEGIVESVKNQLLLEISGGILSDLRLETPPAVIRQKYATPFISNVEFDNFVDEIWQAEISRRNEKPKISYFYLICGIIIFIVAVLLLVASEGSFWFFGFFGLGLILIIRHFTELPGK